MLTWDGLAFLLAKLTTNLQSRFVHWDWYWFMVLALGLIQKTGLADATIKRVRGQQCVLRVW
ncbi:hypothetical protein P4S64_03180 [Vibrio sp. M60_M31a]